MTELQFRLQSEGPNAERSVDEDEIGFIFDCWDASLVAPAGLEVCTYFVLVAYRLDVPSVYKITVEIGRAHV